MEQVVSLFNKVYGVLPFVRVEQSGEVHDKNASLLSSMESFLVFVQRVVLWEDFSQSLTALVCVQMTFWLYHYYQPPVLLLVSCLLLAYVVYEWYHCTVSPDAGVPADVPEDTEQFTTVGTRVLSAPELERYLASARLIVSDTLARLRWLRLHNPVKYVLLCSSVCVSAYWLASAVSGFRLLYLLSTMALTLPGLTVHWLPQSVCDGFSQTLYFLRASFMLPADGYTSEFVPEVSVENTALLEVAAGIVNGCDPTPDLLELSSFTAGLSAPPSLDYHSLTSNSDDDHNNSANSDTGRPSLAPSSDHGTNYESPYSTTSVDGVTSRRHLQQQSEECDEREGERASLTDTVYTAAESVASYVRQRLYGGGATAAATDSQRSLRHQQQQQPCASTAHDRLNTTESLTAAVDDSDFEML